MLLTHELEAQNVRIQGQVYDTLNFRPVRDAMITAIHPSDTGVKSTTKSDYRGEFQLDLPYHNNINILISHANYHDTLFILRNNIPKQVIQTGRIVLNEKTKTFADVEIIAALPVMLVGDTAVFLADSFATRPNAKVEDLLKALPGVEINADGQFVVNGKIVDKIFIDGEEFLSSDFTTTTKNISAKIIQSIQVYEAPPDNRVNTENTEKQQIINLKLKKEAKNSISGDIILGSNFDQFYDNHLFATRFKDKRKIGLLAKNFNTENSGIMRNNRGKIELSIQDQISEKWSVNAKYNLDFLKGTSEESTVKQYLFSDSTFSIEEQNSRLNRNLSNNLSSEFTFKPDTLTMLILKTELKQTNAERQRAVSGLMLDEEQSIFGDSWLLSNEKSTRYEIIHETDFQKKFLKPRRSFNLNQRSNLTNESLSNLLDIENNNDFNPADSVRVNQSKKQAHMRQNHVLHIRYTEPFLKHWALELSYFLNVEQSVREVAAFNRDNNGEFSLFDSIFSNNFKNLSTSNIGGVQVRYEKGTHVLTLRSRLANIMLNNVNLSNEALFEKSINNLQGKIHYTYKIKKEMSFNGEFDSYMRIPTIVQFQPIPDNSNPNQIFVGNPQLNPANHNELRLNFRKWNPSKSTNYNFRLFGNLILNDLSTATSFSSSGQNVVQYINIDKSYRTGFNANFGFPVVKNLLTAKLSQNTNISNAQNIINNKINESLTLNQSGTVTLRYDNKKSIESELTFRGNYTQTKNSLSTFTRPSFWSFKLEFNVNIQLPEKFELSTQLNGFYLTNTRLANANYLIWNAQIKRRFLNSEQLSASISVRDMLNQTTSISRIVNANVIIDSNAELISRFFMFSLSYNFHKNVQSKKERQD